MKDWCVLLSDLTDEQENHLAELCRSYYGLIYSGLDSDEDCIGVYDGEPDYWWSSSKFEKITHKEAVKRLNKLIKQKTQNTDDL